MRPFTPTRTEGSRTIITVKRCCNGCGRPIGDVTEKEIDDAIAGAPLTDVRHECVWCAPFLDEENT